jgi:hypothetical protein
MAGQPRACETSAVPARSMRLSMSDRRTLSSVWMRSTTPCAQRAQRGRQIRLLQQAAPSIFPKSPQYQTCVDHTPASKSAACKQECSSFLASPCWTHQHACMHAQPRSRQLSGCDPEQVLAAMGLIRCAPGPWWTPPRARARPGARAAAPRPAGTARASGPAPARPAPVLATMLFFKHPA